MRIGGAQIGLLLAAGLCGCHASHGLAGSPGDGGEGGVAIDAASRVDASEAGPDASDPPPDASDLCEPHAMTLQDQWSREPLDAFPDRVHVSATPLVLPPSRPGGRPRFAFVSHGVIVDPDFARNHEGPEFSGRMPVELGGVLRVFDAETGETTSWGDPPLFTTLAPTASLAAGDLDGDGELELVALGAWGFLHAFELDLTPMWRSLAPPPAPPIGTSGRRPPIHVSGAPVVADLEGDGDVEVVFGHCVVEGATGEVRFCLEGEHWRGSQGYWGPLVDVADLTGDGALEVVAGTIAYTARGEVLWRHEVEGLQGFATVRDVLRAHPGPEVVLVARARLRFLDPRSGRTLQELPLPGAPGEAFFGCPGDESPTRVPVFAGGPALVGDVEGDGSVEVFVAMWGELLRVQPECEGCEIGWSVPIHDTQSAVTGVSAADLDGDGRVEIVHADETRLRVIDARTGEVRHEALNFSRTRTEFPLIGDFDGDGSAEIAVASGSESCMLRTHGRGNPPGLRFFGERLDRWLDADATWMSHGGPLGEGRWRPTRGSPRPCP
ncbi:MAG: VCBS repeat-containing protein [Myxococcota bacterium]|nr:VCBS repeat-containing protein [Myxococcota bacterium]